MPCLMFKKKVCIISKYGSGTCFISSDCSISLSFGIPYNVLLRAGYDVIKSRNSGKQVFLVRFHIYLTKSLVVFSVYCNCWCQRLPLSPEWMFLAPMLSLAQLRLSPQEKSSSCHSFSWSPHCRTASCWGGDKVWRRERAHHFIARNACVSELWPSHVFVFPSFVPFLGEIGNLEEAGDRKVSRKVLSLKSTFFFNAKFIL